MINMRLLFLTALVTTASFAEVSFIEKKNRVEYLESLASKNVSMNIDAYRRELEYEKQNLPVDKRAENEANLLAEKIKLQVQNSYKLAIETSTEEEAVESVKTAIERDLQLISPDLQNEIREIALEALASAQGGTSVSQNYEDLQKALMKGIEARSEFLNKEAISVLSPAAYGNISNNDEINYKSKAQLLESLVSNEPSTRFSGSANMALRSDVATKRDTNISFQLKADFMGVAVEGGPSIQFRREYNSTAVIMSETLHPVLMQNGHFDIFKRDNTGKIIYKNGKPEKRFLVMVCETNLFFETEYNGGGNFFVHGVGGGQSFQKRYSNNIILASRRIALPETIDGKTVTFDYVKRLCQEDFLRANITNNMTVKDSLNKMMENMVSSLRFTHPKTTCVADKQCSNWYRGLIGLVQLQNVPRCVQDTKEGYRTCDLRGIDNQNCTVFDKNGKRISDGNFEFQCDKGYRCVKVQEAGWFKNWSFYQYAKGRCQR